MNPVNHFMETRAVATSRIALDYRKPQQRPIAKVFGMSVHYLRPTLAAATLAAVHELSVSSPAQTSSPASSVNSQFWQLRRVLPPASQAAFRHVGIGYRLSMIGAGPVLSWTLAVDVRNWSEQRVLKALARTRQERPDLPHVEVCLQAESLFMSTVEQGQHDELEVHALAHAFAERLRAA